MHILFHAGKFIAIFVCENRGVELAESAGRSKEEYIVVIFCHLPTWKKKYVYAKC